MDEEFEWDPVKAESNFRKHGVKFLTARLAFFDPHLQFEEDTSTTGEKRFRVLGEAQGNLLLVIFTVRETAEQETCRIISARPASPRERKRYEN